MTGIKQLGQLSKWQQITYIKWLKLQFISNNYCGELSPVLSISCGEGGAMCCENFGDIA